MNWLLFLLGLLPAPTEPDAIKNYCQEQHRWASYLQAADDKLNTAPANLRSDTIDVLHHHLSLDMTDLATQNIKGSCRIRQVALINGVNLVNYDLLGMTIDSIKANGQLTTYSYGNELLTVYLINALASGDTVETEIFYHGQPQIDASGWGGFYFNNGYAFNLGVGFAAEPHNFGRAWYPCFDNFVERATYSFDILTSGDKVAHCNGELTLETPIGPAFTLRQWEMAQPIPSYLACLAIGSYKTVHQTHNGIQGNISIELAAQANDTTNVKNSFVHLPEAIDAFERWYGPFLWSKVGFTMVPFSSGAMEHATSIAYPLPFVTGTTAYETLMAHELSHHWWGDLATCETAEDMWINEGMASYSEHLFTEAVYGREAYLDAVIDNHLNVLQTAHINENGYRAVSGVPHEYTYGMHVYQKGAVVAHTLRGYLGDSLFAVGLKATLTAKPFQSLNSNEFSDILTTATGVNTADFFNDWIFQPGYSDFVLDSFPMTDVGGFAAGQVHIRQKLRGAPAFHNAVPLEVSFIDSLLNSYTTTVQISGETDAVAVQVPFMPTRAYLNRGHLLNLANGSAERSITAAGNVGMSRAKFTAIANSIVAPVELRVEHHFTAPDPIQNNPLQAVLSANHFWIVDGFFPVGNDLSGRIEFDGRASAQFIDLDLLSVTEDSLILVWRPDASQDWIEYPNYLKSTIGSPTDRRGAIIIYGLRRGQYAFANGTLPVGTATPQHVLEKKDLRIFPNPSSGALSVELKNRGGGMLRLAVFNSNGQLERLISDFPNHTTRTEIEGLAKGEYFIHVQTTTGQFSDKLIVR